MGAVRPREEEGATLSSRSWWRPRLTLQVARGAANGQTLISRRLSPLPSIRPFLPSPTRLPSIHASGFLLAVLHPSSRSPALRSPSCPPCVPRLPYANPGVRQQGHPSFRPSDPQSLPCSRLATCAGPGQEHRRPSSLPAFPPPVKLWPSQVPELHHAPELRPVRLSPSVRAPSHVVTPERMRQESGRRLYCI